MSPLLCEVVALYLKTRANSVRWQTTELAKLFHDKLELFQSNDIEILIDALDECSDAKCITWFEGSRDLFKPQKRCRPRSVLDGVAAFIVTSA